MRFFKSAYACLSCLHDSSDSYQQAIIFVYRFDFYFFFYYLSLQERSGSCRVGFDLVAFCFPLIFVLSCKDSNFYFILLCCFCYYVANGRTLFVVQSHYEVLPRLACMSCILKRIIGCCTDKFLSCNEREPFP